MLKTKQIQEIREFLENSRNPVFFFDNDADGLCSFLILQRFLARGKGVIIKSFPGLNESYFHKVEEFKADCIFVLDKPVIEKDFVNRAKEANIPIIVIDHHQVEPIENTNYYNTYQESGKNEPVSYLCYRITERKEDLWLSFLGSLSDGFIPEFIGEFEERYPYLLDSSYKTAFDIIYKTRLGRIINIINFALKDRTSNVVSLMKFLINAKNPDELLEENSKTKVFLKRFEEINEKYQKLLKKAEHSIEDGIIFFTYSGDLSISQHISNELFYNYPKKVIVVGYIGGNLVNVSLRWEKDIRTAVLNAINNIEGASGGGHEHASGAKIPADKMKEFKENLLREIEKIKKN